MPDNELMTDEPKGYVVIAEGVIASDFALKNLNKSLGEAQNEFGAAVKNETNTYGGYKYTPLSSIIAAVRPALTKHHLTVSQFPSPDLERKTVGMVTRVSHWDSGEWVQSTLELPAELALGKGGTAVFNQQTIGGSITYAQKYAYKPILGIADSEEMIDSTEEKGDLPARAAKPIQQPQRAKQPEPQPQAQPEVPTGVRSQFFSKAKEYGWGLGDIKQFLMMAYHEGSTAKLSEAQLSDALKVMSENKPLDVLKAETEAA